MELYAVGRRGSLRIFTTEVAEDTEVSYEESMKEGMDFGWRRPRGRGRNDMRGLTPRREGAKGRGRIRGGGVVSGVLPVGERIFGLGAGERGWGKKNCGDLLIKCHGDCYLLVTAGGFRPHRTPNHGVLTAKVVDKPEANLLLLEQTESVTSRYFWENGRGVYLRMGSKYFSTSSVPRREHASIRYV